MATQGYDAKKAALYNKLRQQGLSDEAAFTQSGITDAEADNYVVNDTKYNSDGSLNTNRGQIGPTIFGTGTITEAPTAAEQKESAQFYKGLESNNFERVDYPVKANSQPSNKTPITYTTTSTETVSGGGSTTIIAGARTPTAESQTYAAEAAAKQAEINQFTKDNPSNFVRKRQGLPLLTPEEEAANNAQATALRNQKAALVNKQVDAETPGTPTTITTPNTTTTTQTVTSGTTAVNTPVQAPAGDDPAINQQTELQLGTTVSDPARATATSPLSPDSDEALAAAQTAQEVADLRIAAESATPVPPEDNGFPPPPEFNNQPLEFEAVPLDPDTEALLEQQAAINRAQLQQQEAIAYAPAPVPLSALNESEFGATNVVQNQADVDANNSVARGATNRAQQQSTLQTRVNQPAAADWRVRLRLAPNADYLYKVGKNDGGAGILAPLAATDGVVFPYTPSIETSYQAKYDNYDLTHSNYRGYFYKSSMIENISIKGTFTAQDTYEAAYLLAVIHFFKSVTKMFYGQDAQAGTPPPLVYLSGFGKYQFNENPCVVTNFGYSLPNDVDYIRADGFNNIGLNLENRRPRTSGPAIGGSLGTVVAIIDRLTNAGFKNGSLTDRPSPGQVTQNVTNQTSINSTYVPTKMEISITLLPMQTRNQVSKQFSLKSFANGSLLAGGGFW